MAAERSLAELQQEYRIQLHAWENAEPGSPESNEARHRSRQLLARIEDRVADDIFARLLAEWMEVEREKRIAKKRKEQKKDRCSVMAVGGDIFKDNLFGIGDFHNTRLRH